MELSWGSCQPLDITPEANIPAHKEEPINPRMCERASLSDCRDLQHTAMGQVKTGDISNKPSNKIKNWFIKGGLLQNNAKLWILLKINHIQ